MIHNVVPSEIFGNINTTGTYFGQLYRPSDWDRISIDIVEVKTPSPATKSPNSPMSLDVKLDGSKTQIVSDARVSYSILLLHG